MGPEKMFNSHTSGFRARLPGIIRALEFYVWIYPLDVYDVGFYILTTIIGGTVHFMPSKV
jgi:hypothetical protein